PTEFFHGTQAALRPLPGGRALARCNSLLSERSQRRDTKSGVPGCGGSSRAARSVENCVPGLHFGHGQYNTRVRIVGNQRFQPRTMIEWASGRADRSWSVRWDRACFITIRNGSRTKRTCARLMICKVASVARSSCDIDAATRGERKGFVRQYVSWSGAGMLAAHFWRTLETIWVLFRSECPCNQRTNCRQLAARKPLFLLRPIA